MNITHYLTALQAAGLLGQHYNTVYRNLRDGTRPSVKIGKQYLILDTDISDFIKSGKVLKQGQRKHVVMNTTGNPPVDLLETFIPCKGKQLSLEAIIRE